MDLLRKNIPRVDLETRAILSWENRTGRRFELTKNSAEEQLGIDVLVVHHLRHELLENYEERVRASAGTPRYKEIFEESLQVVEQHYPYLRKAIRYIRRRKKLNKYKPYFKENAAHENCQRRREV